MIQRVTKGNAFMNRRSFLRTGFAATAGLALSGLGAAPTRRVKAGVQLYSVRKLCERDFPGTLRALKAMGYEGVQCGGFFGRTAKELNTLFKDHGLAAAGMQMQADRIIKPENIAESVTFRCSELGALSVCSGSTPRQRMVGSASGADVRCRAGFQGGWDRFGLPQSPA